MKVYFLNLSLSVLAINYFFINWLTIIEIAVTPAITPPVTNPLPARTGTQTGEANCFPRKNSDF